MGYQLFSILKSGKAIAEAIEKHRKLGEAIAVWQNGEVVILSADQIPNLENQSK